MANFGHGNQSACKTSFAIGLYGGNHKPSDLAQYLDDFVKECRHLEINEIVVGICVFAFKIHSIVCDAPARSSVRQSKGHNAYGGCDRCRQVGLWLDRVILPNTNAENALILVSAIKLMRNIILEKIQYSVCQLI